MTNATGIDVSKYQQTTPSLKGLSFLFARASIGLQVDALYDTHIANARQAGLLVGAYHFGDNRTSATVQAQFFLKAAGAVDFYVLDQEGGNQFSPSEARTFIATVASARGRCGLYHSLSGFPDYGQDWNWVAYWGNTIPPIPWDFWQYQGSPLDRDMFNGDAAKLAAFAGGVNPPIPIPDPVEDPMGLQFRITARTPGTVKVSGTGHALIRVDDAGFVGAPDGQQREVAALIALTAPSPDTGHGSLPVGTAGYLVGNIPGSSPDTSVAAFLLKQDGVFTPSALDTTHDVRLTVDGIEKAKVIV